MAIDNLYITIYPPPSPDDKRRYYVEYSPPDDTYGVVGFTYWRCHAVQDKLWPYSWALTLQYSPDVKAGKFNVFLVNWSGMKQSPVGEYTVHINNRVHWIPVEDIKTMITTAIQRRESERTGE